MQPLCSRISDTHTDRNYTQSGDLVDLTTATESASPNDVGDRCNGDGAQDYAKTPF